MPSHSRATPPGAAIDPRVERSRQVILQAALDELGEVGYGTFRIESVAARARVGKSTIYRHWQDKLALIADAFETFHVQMVPGIETGTPRERIQSLVRHVAEVFADSTFSVCIPALIEGAERDPRLRAFHHQYSAGRRQSLIDVIAEGIAAGDFPAHLDPELAALALLGPIVYGRLMSSEPFDPGRSSDLVDTVLGLPGQPRGGSGRMPDGAVLEQGGSDRADRQGGHHQDEVAGDSPSAGSARRPARALRSPRQPDQRDERTVTM
jgi:TetR/AcrR family transcriptional regulator of autoinduction and epiphytic fitness